MKTAARLSESDVEALPDDQFALVLLDGGFKMKKYATVDAGNTALSILYLIKQAHLLPKEALKLAATNLISACQVHDLDVPEELLKLAGPDVVPFSEPPKESRKNPQLGGADAAWDNVAERTNRNGVPGDSGVTLPTFPKEMQKVASEMVAKQKVWREAPYFDASDWDPSEHSVNEEAPMPERTLLDEKFPVDSFSQVKTASAYFNENWTKLHPRDRHTYCVKLASRMEELGMQVPSEMERYASSTYAADVEGYVGLRRQHVEEEFHPALNMLLEKRAQVSPETFAEALSEFDYATGIRWEWDASVPDPWMSTFGPSYEKLAEEHWHWEKEDTRITKDDLENLARNGHHLLCKSFGADFAKEFSKKPKDVFMSLPEPNKLILARLASDRHAGTATE